jgi:thioredoxin-like negative regulator of GroEL
MEVSKSYQQDSLRKVESARQLAASGDYAECIRVANELLDDNFNDALALFLVGYAFLKSERYGLAYNIFRRVAELNPRSEPWNNAGMCHQETWNLDDAEICFRKALQLEPNNPAAMQNLALIYINRCKPEEALKWVKKAEETGNNSWEALDNKALSLLMLGKYDEGFKAYRATAGRQKQRTIRAYRDPEEPMWEGQKGKVVIYGTQGLGDELSFASCIPDALEKAEVVIDCDHRLEGLFRRSFPQAKVYGTRFKEPHWKEEIDYSIPVDCLPALFRSKPEDFPGKPYLKADPERRIQWRALFDTLRKPVIGVAWTGGLNNTGKKKRSLKLEDLEPIFRSIDATWVSLEYRDRDDEIQAFYEKTGIQIHQWKRATRTEDYDDTAGLVAELDLVVSVSTAVIHLAGALGKDCWVLVPNKPRWFYLLEGEIPWYKSVKLFRQKQNGEWPIGEVSRLLKLRCS